MNHEKTGGLTARQKISGAGFFWNAVYAGLNAIQSAVLLFAISRTKDLAVAGIITIGFTIGNLAAIIGRYGIRNYQVTDVNEQFRFQDYFFSRVITVAGALLLSLVYLTAMSISGRYTPEKSLIVLEIILLKIVGSMEEVFVGRLQQKGRLDVGARIASVRIGAATMVVFTAIWVIPSLPLCLLLGITAEILLDITLIPTGRRYASFPLSPTDRKAAVKLMKAGVPLCIGVALHNYVGNAPKYLVDLFLTDNLQAVCGYVMMPMFVLTVLNSFVMQPAVKGLGDAWNTDPGLYWSKVRKHILLLLGLTVAVLGAGFFIGLPLLSMMYRVELRPFRKEFLILMTGGGLYTISAYLIVLLTTMRRQYGIVWGCGAAVLVYLTLGGMMTRNAGFTGACWLYIIANAAMTAVLLTFLLANGIRGRHNDNGV